MPNNKKPSGNEFKSSGFMLAVNLAILSNSKDAEIIKSPAWIHRLSPDEGWMPFRASNRLGTYPAQAQYSFYVPLHGTFKFIISIRKNRRKDNVAFVFLHQNQHTFQSKAK